MIKDTSFYNQESSNYSGKRYPEVASSYIHYFFKKRLSIVISLLRKEIGTKDNLSLLEVGCADGVVIKRILETTGNMFASAVGIDTAEGMIAAARLAVPDNRAAFFVRGREPQNTYDVVIEVGVANYADFDEELIHAKARLKDGGIYILSIAGTSSLNAFFGKGKGYNNFLSYAEYEAKIKSHFTITATVPVGFYVPFVWRLPAVARMLQPATEYVLRCLTPDLFHEKVYVLSKIR